MPQPHDDKPVSPSTPASTPAAEEQVSSAGVYKFAALFFGVPLVLLLVMVFLTH